MPCSLSLSLSLSLSPSLSPSSNLTHATPRQNSRRGLLKQPVQALSVHGFGSDSWSIKVVLFSPFSEFELLIFSPLSEFDVTGSSSSCDECLQPDLRWAAQRALDGD